MSVIPVSHVAVTRARKSLNHAFLNGRWEELEECDEVLASTLNRAFDDIHKDHRYLMNELEKILAVYGEVTKAIPAEEDLRPQHLTCNHSVDGGTLFCVRSSETPRA